MEIKELKKGQLQNMEHFQFASHVAALCDEANIELVNAVLEPLKQAIEQEDKALNLPRQEEGTKELEQLDRARPGLSGAATAHRTQPARRRQRHASSRTAHQ